MSTCTLVAAADGMSTHSLSGSGVQLLTADTTALHVSITTLSPFGGIGNANPANHYHQALLRPGDGTGFWAPVPVEGGPQWIGLPNGTDRIGYACEGGAVISVVEVIGGTSPFAGPPGSDGPAGPAGPAGSGAISTLSADLGASVNVTSGGTYVDGPSVTLGVGTWFVAAHCTMQLSNSGNDHSTAKLWDGTTVYASSEVGGIGFFRIAHPLSALIVVASGTKTVKISATNTGGAGQMLAATLNGGTPAKATGIVALQVA